jgi:hypothetical protein
MKQIAYSPEGIEIAFAPGYQTIKFRTSHNRTLWLVSPDSHRRTFAGELVVDAPDLATLPKQLLLARNNFRLASDRQQPSSITYCSGSRTGESP